MSALWFRVPEWCALSDDPAEAAAAMWLLGRWHLGREPSVADLKRAHGWGWDRASTFATRLWTWAEEAGARRPDASPGKSGSNRGGSVAKPGRQEAGPVDVVEPDRGAIGEAPGSYRGASRAPVLLPEKERLEREDPGGIPRDPPPPSPGPWSSDAESESSPASHPLDPSRDPSVRGEGAKVGADVRPEAHPPTPPQAGRGASEVDPGRASGHVEPQLAPSGVRVGSGQAASTVRGGGVDPVLTLPPDLPALLPDNLDALMPEAGMGFAQRLVYAGIETPEQLLEFTYEELCHSKGIAYAGAKKIRRELAKGPWRLKGDGPNDKRDAPSGPSTGAPRLFAPRPSPNDTRRESLAALDAAIAALGEN